ncbi:uncharacterized protein MONBRDRAFT_34543 [Monosiga brevicollis MX1]|uniref:GPS domain-containing protein n=1 Tax=Monosiga brevicollis TaxID=81824 RepID=A9VCG0_MONBE|nr:uncharacterized protein MONBRDRAFT_34543 [Monosiga brevicollis MX1]EDQ84742.1 predicted protein [Monosiga brevicollis MX1]|eukprot:XP_001750392.1 hypothetical protein [Monosiga brevicollis MX1]
MVRLRSVRSGLGASALNHDGPSPPLFPLLFCLLALTPLQLAAGQLCQTESVPWTLLFTHDRSAGGVSLDGTNVATKATAPTLSTSYAAAIYSRLDELAQTNNSLVSWDGYYYFRLRWPEICQHPFYQCDDNATDYVIWRQTSNPMLSDQVTGYEWLAGSAFENAFSGLLPGSNAILDAQDGFNYWYSVGVYSLLNDLLMGPIPNGEAFGLATTRVELAIKVYANENATFETGFGTTCGAEWATCSPATGACTCPTAYMTGDGDDRCFNIDECAAMTCHENAHCVNHWFGATCRCRDGYTGNGYACQANECYLGTHNCDQNADCADTPTGFTCTCREGWTGDGTSCADIDECRTMTDDCDIRAACHNTIGGYNCTCPEGLSGDGHTCINELLFWYDASTGITNGTVFDLSGNDIHANATDTIWVDHPLFGPRFFFNGSNTSLEELLRVDLDLSPDNYPDITMEIFFQPIEPDWRGYIIDSDDGGYDRSFGFYDERYISLDVDEPFVMGAGTGSPFNSGLGTPWPRCWHIAFAVFSQEEEHGSFLTLNGFQGYGTTAYNNKGSSLLTIGGSDRNGGMVGYIKDVKIYNRALTRDEIWLKYQAAQSELTCECLSGYRGNETTGCVDVDECALSEDDCNPLGRATCTNTLGSYNCTCNAGFIGDGRTCNPEDVACAVSVWVDDGDCSATCGYGWQRQIREVIRPAQGSGAACPALTRDIACYSTATCTLDTDGTPQTSDVYDVSILVDTSALDSSALRVPEVATAVSGRGTIVLLAELAEDTQTALEYAFIPAGSANTAAFVSALRTELAGTGTVLASNLRDSCFCPGEQDARSGLGYFGAPCGNSTRRAPTCGAGSSAIINRVCSVDAIWLDAVPSNCSNSVLQAINSGLTPSNARTRLAAAATSAAASSGVLSATDVAEVGQLLSTVLLYHLEEQVQLTSQDMVYVVRAISGVLGTEASQIAAGLNVTTNGADFFEELEAFLLLYMDDTMPVNSSLAMLEPNFALQLVHAQEVGVFNASWPPSSTSLTESVVCEGVGANQSCSVIEYSAEEANFDPNLYISLPEEGLVRGMAAEHGRLKFMMSAFASAAPMPGTGGLDPSSQVLMATIAGLASGATLNNSFLTYSALPTAVNYTECGYWAPGGWSVDGCSLVESGTEAASLDVAVTEPSVMHCQCNHLTHFAIVEREQPQAARTEPKLADSMRSSAAIAATGLAAVLCLFLVQYRRYSVSRVAVMHLAVAVLAYLLLFAITVDRTDEEACRDYAIGMHTTLTLAFAWTVVLALLLTYGLKLRMWIVMVVGYGAPGLVMLVVPVTLHRSAYGRNRNDYLDNYKHCYIEDSGDIFWGYAAPLLAFGFAALCFFLVAMMRALFFWKPQPFVEGHARPRRSHAISMAFFNMLLLAFLGAIAGTSVYGLNGRDDDFYRPLFSAFCLFYGLLFFLLYGLHEIKRCVVGPSDMEDPDAPPPRTSLSKTEAGTGGPDSDHHGEDGHGSASDGKEAAQGELQPSIEEGKGVPPVPVPGHWFSRRNSGTLRVFTELPAPKVPKPKKEKKVKKKKIEPEFFNLDDVVQDQPTLDAVDLDDLDEPVQLQESRLADEPSSAPAAPLVSSALLIETDIDATIMSQLSSRRASLSLDDGDVPIVNAPDPVWLDRFNFLPERQAVVQVLQEALVNYGAELEELEALEADGLLDGSSLAGSHYQARGNRNARDSNASIMDFDSDYYGAPLDMPDSRRVSGEVSSPVVNEYLETEAVTMSRRATHRSSSPFEDSTLMETNDAVRHGEDDAGEEDNTAPAAVEEDMALYVPYDQNASRSSRVKAQGTEDRDAGVSEPASDVNDDMALYVPVERGQPSAESINLPTPLADRGSSTPLQHTAVDEDMASENGLESLPSDLDVHDAQDE